MHKKLETEGSNKETRMKIHNDSQEHCGGAAVNYPDSNQTSYPTQTSTPKLKYDNEISKTQAKNP